MLELAVARELYERFPEFAEGRMAKIRSHVVSRASCALVARELELGQQLVARARDLASAESTGAGAGGKGLPQDEAERLADNRNVLAALLEASLAALFLEHGFHAVEGAIVEAFRARIEYALTNHVDYKTELQEALARRGRSVGYTVLEVEGPPHERTFTAAAVVDGVQVGTGRGSSKKAAEQEAAEEALERLELDEPS